MRDLLKRQLGRGLSAMPPQDRLAAAWLVACGRALAGRAAVTGYADGVVRVEVRDAAWIEEMGSLRGQLAAELVRIAGVKVAEIHFVMKKGQRLDERAVRGND